MTERFATTLDCADISFLPDGILDGLPAALPARRHPYRRHRPEQARIRAALSAALALAAAPHGFTAAEFTAKIQQVNKHADYTARQGAYDLRKLRGKNLAVKPGRDPPLPTSRPEAARTIAALLALRDQIIAPILAGVRSPRRGRKPTHWTTINRPTTRPSAWACKTSSTTSGSRPLRPPPHRQHFVDRRNASS